MINALGDMEWSSVNTSGYKDRVDSIVVIADFQVIYIYMSVSLPYHMEEERVINHYDHQNIF